MKKKNVYLFGTSSMLNDISSEMLQAVLPSFLVYVGMPYPLIGLVSGLRELMSKIFMSFGGIISNRFGRKKAVIFGYSLSAAFKLLLIISKGFSIITTLSMERIGKSIREAPRDSMLSDYKNRGEAFGIHRSMDTLGAIIGVIIAYFLVSRVDMVAILIISSIFGFLSVVPLFFVREDDGKKSVGKNYSYDKGRFNKFSIVSSIYYMGSISYMFLMLFSQEFIDIEGSILLYLLFNVVYMILAIPMGKLASKKGISNIIRFGFLAFLISMFSFTSKNIVGIMLGFVFYGIAYSMIEGNRRYYIAKLCKNPELIGKYYTIIGISSIIGNTFAGYLFGIGNELIFYYSIIMMFISTTLSYIWREEI